MTEKTPKLEELSVADSKITSYKLESGVLTISLIDWQERSFSIRFEDVLALRDLGIAGVDLRDVAQNKNDAFFSEALNHHEGEDTSLYSCFLFFSAWSNAPDLKIVARCFSIIGK